ncbi:MAG TPA: hypothetical protein VEU33_45200 [Archangium sp.]|nr:hypothetical protein [Archangium sp.]
MRAKKVFYAAWVTAVNCARRLRVVGFCWVLEKIVKATPVLQLRVSVFVGSDA